MPALDNFFLIALPYLAVVICLVGSFYRIKTRPMTYSALSSQFLESKGLMWGSLPWHIGIITIIAAHFIAFLARLLPQRARRSDCSRALARSREPGRL